MTSITEEKTVREELKLFGLRLCICTVIGMLLLAAGEGIALYWRIRLSPPTVQSDGQASAYAGESWAAQYDRESLLAEQVQYKPYVVWRRAPFSGKTINIDSEGIRKTWYSFCEKDVLTIWMFGDSALWGSGSPDWETIPSFLAKRYSESGRKICVKNYGEKGWVSTQEAIQLILALKQASNRPDMVIFYDGVSDSFAPYLSSVPDSHTNFDDTKRIFEEASSEHGAGLEYLKHSNTYQLLAVLHKQLAPTASPAEPRNVGSGLSIDDMAERTLDNYQKNMDLVATLAQHYGVRCLFVWQPVLLVGAKPKSAEEEAMVRRVESQLRPGASLLMQATYGRAETISRPGFLYLGGVFAGNARTMYVSFSHTTPEGNRVIAEKIFDFANMRAVREAQGHAERTNLNQPVRLASTTPAPRRLR